ncbi:MAG: SEC-C domain-containing protein [Lachnospiraceae bacterium]|nr:SEC-C domain-containing protein [Lachnospiraceae bacterium]
MTRTSQQVRQGVLEPNDPCPCGSGKKFKKCCGRK